nr:MAG TPA: hypothetical protein [Caudoviricetes sp.]
MSRKSQIPPLGVRRPRGWGRPTPRVQLDFLIFLEMANAGARAGTNGRARISTRARGAA